MGKCSLVFGTASGQSSGNDFAALGYKVSQCLGIFVIYRKARIGTKAADFSAMINSSFSSWF
jgi:hypothetical protein